MQGNNSNICQYYATAHVLEFARLGPSPLIRKDGRDVVGLHEVQLLIHLGHTHFLLRHDTNFRPLLRNLLTEIDILLKPCLL